jgi:LDH2 family malate/lactate/ureidoglycolate dehydrogenase
MDEETRPYVSWDLVGSFMVDAFKAAGIPEDDAKICADVLMESDRRGIESHGTNRFKPIYIDRINAGILNPVTDYEVLKETPTTLVADAHDGMGMVASHKAMTSVIEKAKECGLAMATVTNSSHYGIAGYWATMASKQGLIGFTGTNARSSIAPTFGVENMMGTNPLTFAMPTDEEFPFCIDCATSIVQRGRIEYYAREGKPTPAGTVVSENGEAMTDSAEILKALTEGKAALAPVGGIGDELAGYKGYGWAAVVEILSSALAGGLFMKDLTNKDPDGSPRPYHLGHFFMAIDPEAFMGLDTFRHTAGEICRELRASKKAPGHDRIWTAGEKEWDVWQVRKDKGVPMGDGVQQDFIAVRDMYHLPYTFPFEA